MKSYLTEVQTGTNTIGLRPASYSWQDHPKSDGDQTYHGIGIQIFVISFARQDK